MQLIDSDEYSDFICNECQKKLTDFSLYQTELIDKQTRLYQFVGQDARKIVDESVVIKVEYLDLSPHCIQSYQALLTNDGQDDIANINQETQFDSPNSNTATNTNQQHDQFSLIISTVKNLKDKEIKF